VNRGVVLPSLAAIACGFAIGCSPASSSATGAAGGCEAAPVSFQRDVMAIFAASCSTSSICHGQMNEAAEENLYLGLSATPESSGPGDVAAVYAGLVGMKSLEDPSMNLVTAGDLDASYLWHKISGDPNSDTAVAMGCEAAATGANPCSDCSAAAPCGVPMPFTGSLDPSAICTIQNWIMQGANDN
jgi:hypothetical protein